MLKSILSSITFKQLQTTVAGTIVNGGLGALFYILLARLLGPSEFGLLTVSITTLALIADIADIGTNTGLIRFVSKNLASSSSQAYAFLKLGLKIKLISWLVSFLIIFLLAPILAEQVFHKVELIMPLKLAAFGVGGALLFSFTTATLQAFQKYLAWSIVNILTNLLRLLIIILLGYYLILNVENSLLVYISLPFFGFFLTLLILPTRKILQSQDEFKLFGELFKFSLPVAAFSIIAAFSARLDTYLNAALLSAKEVGIYGAANQLVQIMPQIISALGLVSAPKFASFENNQQMLTYFKKFQVLVLGLCLLGLFTIPVAIYLIPILFGPSYQEATSPYIFLFLGQLIFLFSIPVHHSIIFYFGRSDIFIWVALGHLIIISGLGYFMISSFGMVGAAITVLIGMIFNFLYPLTWFLIKLRKT